MCNLLNPLLARRGFLVFLLLFAQLTFAQTQPTPVAWTFAGPSGSNDRIISFAMDPRNESVIYAATPGGIWKTQDAGATWTAVFESQSSMAVCSIVIDPQLSDVIYAGTGDDQSPRPAQGVVRSTDGGRTWTSVQRITDRPVCTLAIDPTSPARIFAGSEEGLFLSTDAATTWTKVLKVPVTSVAFGGPGVVYAGILGDTSPGERQHLLTRSTDGGRTWTDLTLPRNSNSPVAAANWINVLTSGSALFVAVSSVASPLSQVDFYSSNDAGNLWFSTFGIGQARPPMAMLFDPNGNLYIAAATLLSSANGGQTWTTVPTTKSQFHAGAYRSGTLLLAGEQGFENLAAGGQGLSPFPIAQILGVAVEPGRGVWAAGPAGLFGLFPSSPYSASGVPGIAAPGRISITTPANGSTNIYTASATNVYASTNGGVAFSSQSVIPADELRAPYPPLVADPVVTATLYVAGRRLYRSNDNGDTWSALAIVDPDPTRVVTAMAMAPSARSTLFAATACLPEIALTTCPPISVVWRSTNAGQTWAQMSVVAGLVSDFAIDPRQGTRVYAAIGGFPAGPSTASGQVPGDILLSTNAGAAWVSTLGNLPRTGIHTLLIDPASLPPLFNLPAQTLYAGTDAGVFVSFDAGTRWMDISSGLPGVPITDLALLQPDGILAAATFGRGVFSASVLGIGAGVIVDPLLQDVTLAEGTSTDVGIALINLSTSVSVDWQLRALDSWLSVPQTTGNLRQQTSVRLPVAVSAASLRTGTYIGRLQLTSVFGVQNILVETHVTPSPAQMTIAGGNDPSGLPEATLPPLRVLVVDSDGTPLPNVPVTFTITSGGGSLNARTVPTNASGIAGVVLTLPSNPGTIEVTAAVGALSVTFHATAIAAPSLLTDSIFDGVTFNANASFGPGSILAIFGQNLAPREAVATGALPLELATTRVLLTTPDGDLSLPLFSVAPLEVRALMPLTISPGRYLLRVEVGSVRSNEVEIGVAPFAPGIFTVSGGGRGTGIFVKENGTVVSATNPADRGSRVTFFASGLGAVNPPVDAGAPGATQEPLNRTIQTPRVFFDRFAGTVLYSGLVPGIAGRYQVTVQIPGLVAPATNVSVSVTIGGYTSNRVTIPVR